MKVNSISIIVMVLILSGMLILSDNLEFVYAVTYNAFIPTGATGHTIRGAWQLSSSQIAVHDATDGVFRYITPNNLLIGTCAVNDGAYYQNRNHFPTSVFGGGIGEKFKHTLFDVDTLSCGSTSIDYSATCNTAGGNIFIASTTKAFIACDSVAHAVFKFNPTTMTIDYTSGSLNGGAFPCNVPNGMVYDSGLDVTIIQCVTGGQIVLYSGSEPSQATAIATLALGGLSTSSDEPFVIDTLNKYVYVYSTSTSTGIHRVSYTSTTKTNESHV